MISSMSQESLVWESGDRPRLPFTILNEHAPSKAEVWPGPIPVAFFDLKSIDGRLSQEVR